MSCDLGTPLRGTSPRSGLTEVLADTVDRELLHSNPQCRTCFWGDRCTRETRYKDMHPKLHVILGPLGSTGVGWGDGQESPVDGAGIRSHALDVALAMHYGLKTTVPSGRRSRSL